jgi:hypothetical protein
MPGNISILLLLGFDVITPIGSPTKGALFEVDKSTDPGCGQFGVPPVTMVETGKLVF